MSNLTHVPDELRALFQAFLDEKAAQQGLVTPEVETDGARLHAEKNAPWVNGQYSKLKFPVYVHQEYPKMVFGPGYLKAADTLAKVRAMRIKADQQQDYQIWLAEAEAAKAEQTKVVGSRREWDALGSLWRESPEEATQAEAELQMVVAQAAAESAYDDRRLSEKARAEREAFDDASDVHVVEVPETPKVKRGRPTKAELAARAAAEAQAQA